jgi:hypothetical protein
VVSAGSAGGASRAASLEHDTGRGTKLNGRPFVFGARLVVGCEGDYPKRMAGDGVVLRSDDLDFQKLKCTVLVLSL